MNRFEDFKRINTLPFRNYYIPFNVNEEFKFISGIIDKTKSSEVLMLNGNWKFKALNRPNEFNLEDELPDMIDVPSCVQMRGYDHIQYINCRTPFPVMPPYVPKDNPSFHYQRTFNVSLNNTQCYLLNFDGVDSFFDLYINNQYVGSSQISHSLSEFDITRYLLNGTNKIDVLVVKWSAGSYLECQDKFRFTGIFRDVYLMERPINHITDYRINTKDADLEFINNSNVDIELSFLGKNITCKANQTVYFKDNKVDRWSPENPNLYDLVLTSNNEKILERIGFRDLKIDGKLFTIDNKLFKLKGVNRHEFNPDNGATVTLDNILEDLHLMKQLNVNAIRTSHYPNVPDFYFLCDLLGFYLIDEADLEMHEGATMLGGYSNEPWQALADNMIFEDAIYEREKSLVERDKNRCSVIIWSMGNESSYGYAFDKGNKFLKNDGTRPVHYEGVCNTVRDYIHSDVYDIDSNMYPSIETILKDHIDNPEINKPYILCEYSHAMGNTCGDLRDYWKLIYSRDDFVGAFVWEWADHAIRTKEGFKYGGDFNETEHDENFCCDGLLTTDRKLKSSALEMAAVYSGKLDSPITDIKLPIFKSTNSKIEVEYDFESAEIKQIYKDNIGILCTPMHLNINRFIDNDRGIRWNWYSTMGVDKAIPYVFKYNEIKNGYHFECAMVKNCITPAIFYNIDYVLENNELSISLEYRLDERCKLFPRIGLEFAVSDSYQDFKYVGFGPYESYVDRHISCEYGLYNGKVRDNYFHYVMPQESGSHYNTKYFELNGLFGIIANAPFSFSANPYTTKQLIDTKHDFELKETGLTNICLDLSMMGVGTMACGPTIDHKYQVPLNGKNTFKIKF